jgi:hypothetical protein
MEATLGISLYSYLHLKLGKTLSLLSLMFFSSTKLENKRVEQVLLRRRGRGEMTQTMYTHVSKCKIKERKKRSIDVY